MNHTPRNLQAELPPPVAAVLCGSTEKELRSLIETYQDAVSRLGFFVHTYHQRRQEYHEATGLSYPILSDDVIAAANWWTARDVRLAQETAQREANLAAERKMAG